LPSLSRSASRAVRGVDVREAPDALDLDEPLA